MQASVTLLAPAKLNLFLHITGRREDGYHELQTIFQLLDVGDELTFTKSAENSVSLTCSNPELANEDNLVMKAVRSIEQHVGKTLPVAIHLDKKLPMGGGIGGGSSDCATTLLALNHLFQLNIPKTSLMEIATSLGADVPVFVNGKTAWAEGIGEKLTTLDVEPMSYVVLHPNVHVSTAQLFTHPQLTRNTPISTIRPALAREGQNDFEPLVRKLYPEIEKAFQLALPLGKAKLTGTGACLFIPVSDSAKAQAMLDNILASSPSLFGFVANSVATSPVFDQLQSASF